MAKRDLSTEVLIQIRDELKATREQLSDRIDQTNSRLDQTNSRLDQTNSRLERLEKRQGDTEVRVSTELLAVAVNELRDVLLEDRELRTKVDDHERRISLLEHHAD